MTRVILKFLSHREFVPFYTLITSVYPGSSRCQPALSPHDGKVTFFLLNADPAKIAQIFSPGG